MRPHPSRVYLIEWVGGLFAFKLSGRLQEYSQDTWKVIYRPLRLPVLERLDIEHIIETFFNFLFPSAATVASAPSSSSEPADATAHQDDLTTLFCSKTVAAAYKAAGLIAAHRPAMDFLPKHYTEGHEDFLDLQRGASFGPEYLVTFERSPLQEAHSAVAIGIRSALHKSSPEKRAQLKARAAAAHEAAATLQAAARGLIARKNLQALQRMGHTRRRANRAMHHAIASRFTSLEAPDLAPSGGAPKAAGAFCALSVPEPSSSAASADATSGRSVASARSAASASSPSGSSASAGFYAYASRATDGGLTTHQIFDALSAHPDGHPPPRKTEKLGASRRFKHGRPEMPLPLYKRLQPSALRVSSTRASTARANEAIPVKLQLWKPSNGSTGSRSAPGRETVPAAPPRAGAAQPNASSPPSPGLGEDGVVLQEGRSRDQKRPQQGADVARESSLTEDAVVPVAAPAARR